MINWQKITVLVVLISGVACNLSTAGDTADRWQIGVPIATYYAGPPMTETAARQMAEAGFNLVWCNEQELDTAQKFGLRALLTAPETMNPQTMNDEGQIAKLDALIKRVRKHPAMYAYYIIDEPSASLFPLLGKLVAHLREKDPYHMAYINLFPTYATNEQLGNTGDTVSAYLKHLNLFMEQVKPDLLSYDHYHFTSGGNDGNQYFLNLGMIREKALEAGIPFLNIVQGCTWCEGMRPPNRNEMRWLNYTSLAYGAQGISYYVYYSPGHYYDRFGGNVGGMMKPDGSTTPQYEAAKELNPQFIAVASELQPLHSLAVYHKGTVPWGAKGLPDNASFSVKFSGEEPLSTMPDEGILLGYFGNKGGNPTHVLVVNLNYKRALQTTVVGPGRLSLFDASTRKWTEADGSSADITLPPGGGKLFRGEPTESSVK